MRYSAHTGNFTSEAHLQLTKLDKISENAHIFVCKKSEQDYERADATLRLGKVLVPLQEILT